MPPDRPAHLTRTVQVSFLTQHVPHTLLHDPATLFLRHLPFRFFRLHFFVGHVSAHGPTDPPPFSEAWDDTVLGAVASPEQST